MFGLVPVSLASAFFAHLPTLLAFSAAPLAHLRPLDIAVIAIYFGMVVWIGFYLKGKSNTSEEFFMAGREMTAWIAGLSFVSANMGSWNSWGGRGRLTSMESWPLTGIGWAPSRPCCFWAW